MLINIIAIGKNMPTWVNSGFREYAKRLAGDIKINLIEISPEKRTKNSDLEKIKKLEGEKLLATIPKNSLIIALDEHGKQWSTQQLAKTLQDWRENYAQVSLLIGGPEGLAETCLQRAQLKWSLSNLTFPHPLVRIIVAEQLYRAYSILMNHPYHRD
jgi:23S rRNA (pseudouridine1915-N3)-methyltransferase